MKKCLLVSTETGFINAGLAECINYIAEHVSPKISGRWDVQEHGAAAVTYISLGIYASWRVPGSRVVVVVTFAIFIFTRPDFRDFFRSIGSHICLLHESCGTCTIDGMWYRYHVVPHPEGTQGISMCT
jgi:hypothetical protein